MRKTTLVVVLEHEPKQRVLLGYKRQGFGQGKYSGFGGKVEANESIEQAAVRELHEESGLRCSCADLQPVGRLYFEFPARPAWNQETFLFLVERWQGLPVMSREMQPVWFALADIPYQQMWQDAQYWLPYMVGHHFIEAIFVFAADNETVATQQWLEIRQNKIS